MKTQKISPFKIEQDYRIFFSFMTLVLIGMYVMTMFQNSSLRQSWLAVLFTILMIVHIALHWMVVRIIQVPSYKAIYIIGQGLLAFVITHLSNNTGMVFSLYMALIGETIGFLGISRNGALSTIYYLILSLINFVLFTNMDSAVYWLLTVIPVVIFISMYVTLYVRQAEARERAELLATELETANHQLTEYAARVEDLTIVAERQRMARELHDTLAQGVAGLVLQLEAVKAHLASNRIERASAIVEQSITRAGSTLAESRAAIDDLRAAPANLTEAVREKMDRFTQATGIPCDLEISVNKNQLSPETTNHALNILSESLTNIARHAQATQVHVKWMLQDQNLELEVRDNGKGFDVNQKLNGSYGLVGMHERARLTGGMLSIESNNGGTCIQFIVGRS